MEYLIRRATSRAASRHFDALRTITCSPRTNGRVSCIHKRLDYTRPYATNPPRTSDHPPGHSDTVEESSYAQPAHKVSQDITHEEKSHYDTLVEHSKEQQVRSPWTRAGSDVPPVARKRSAGAMVKGKLLTTPSRMLKLVMPLTPKDTNNDRKDVEPLALLVHPQQPLSYLERLIQAELPAIKDKSGNEKIPAIVFRAEDPSDEHGNHAKEAQTKNEQDGQEQENQDFDDDADHMFIDGKLERTGKIRSRPKTDESVIRKKDPEHPNFVRWSPSTEIGDFIRDASQGKEFSIEIEGAPEPVYVAVPSFADRTFYLRMRLRKTSKRIAAMADIKKECDELAHKGGKRVAQGGFAILVGWWYLVYRLTFETELGWDVMEPVTYLVGLSTLIGGYMWFLYHNREVSYRSAMNVTISKRQSRLYDQRGLDLPTWEALVEEGNKLRREIKMVAEEYDVEWNEKAEELDDKVHDALRDGRQKKKKGKKDESDEKKKDPDDDDD
ncbi:hypothetical protein MBLNU457_6722t1 [Dothideomycetes sp. NU457]